MTIGTRNDADEIFAALNLRFSGIRITKWNAEHDTQQGTHDGIGTAIADHVLLPDESDKISPHKKLEHTIILNPIVACALAATVSHSGNVTSVRVLSLAAYMIT